MVPWLTKGEDFVINVAQCTVTYLKIKATYVILCEKLRIYVDVYEDKSCVYM